MLQPQCWFLQYRDVTTVESELNGDNPYLGDNTNEEGCMNPYATHAYVAVNKKEDGSESKPELSPDNILPQLYANLIAEVKADDNMTV